MNRLFVMVTGVLLAVGLVACKKDKKKAPETETKAVETGKQAETPPAETPPPEEPPKPAHPDSDLAAPVGVNLADVKWQEGPPALPKGWQISVLEGAPPFPADKTFAFLAKLPKNYTIPPHTHLVSERVTVLKGTLNLGHGETLDKKAAKAVKPGGLFLIPAGHVHFAFTGGEEAIISVQGVGPWGIFYVDPKNDPRQPPPEKPADVKSEFDTQVEATITQANEVKFEEPPAGMLPPGAKLAVLEGNPQEAKSFTIRIKAPSKYKFPVHSHGITDRVTVISGALMFAVGDTWSDKDLKEMKPGAVGMVPKGVNHYGAAKGETVFQVFGVGPLDIKWANPDDDPAKAGGAGKTP